MAKQELSFRGNDESESSNNQGSNRELHFLHYVPLLAQHLIDAMKDVVVNKIKNDINVTDFIAIMIDETSDWSKKSQLTTIFRYLDESGTCLLYTSARGKIN